MKNIIIGNIIGLFASLILVYSSIPKTKKKILYFQTTSIGLSVISNAVLGGISGAIINIINLIRNILCYKNKLNIIGKTIITLASTTLILKFNNLKLIGLLPLISSVSYVWLMDIKDVKKFKLLFAFTMTLWLIYDLTIKAYTSAIFDIITITMNLLTITKTEDK